MDNVIPMRTIKAHDGRRELGMAVWCLSDVKFLVWHSFLPIFPSLRPPYHKMLSGGER